VPMEPPLVPNKPVQNLITDESSVGMWAPSDQTTDSTVMSNITVVTADESTIPAVVSIVSTLAVLLALTVIFYLVS